MTENINPRLAVVFPTKKRVTVANESVETLLLIAADKTCKILWR